MKITAEQLAIAKEWENFGERLFGWKFLKLEFPTKSRPEGFAEFDVNGSRERISLDMRKSLETLGKTKVGEPSNVAKIGAG